METEICVRAMHLLHGIPQLMRLLLTTYLDLKDVMKGVTAVEEIVVSGGGVWRVEGSSSSRTWGRFG